MAAIVSHTCRHRAVSLGSQTIAGAARLQRGLDPPGQPVGRADDTQLVFPWHHVRYLAARSARFGGSGVLRTTAMEKNMVLNEQQRHEFKLVKRRLSAVQKVIKMDLKDGRLPRPADAADFVASSQAMERLGDRRWHAAMKAYMVHLERFESAMAQGDRQAVHDRFQDLLAAKVACHKAFR